MRYKSISAEMYIRNRKKLEKLLKPGSLAIINSNDEMPRTGDQTYPFRQNSDLFYLTGLDQEKCILSLCPDHPVENLREILFTVRTSDLMVTWNGHKYTPDEIRTISGIQNVRWLEDFELTLRDILITIQTVYLNQNEYPKFSTELETKDVRFARFMKNNFPLHNYERLAPLVTSLRVIKEPEEIQQLQIACNITNKGLNRVLKFVRPGVKEYEIEAEFTHEFLLHGASGHAYSPIIASGKNACVLHYQSNDQLCRDGDLVLMDVGAEYGNYAADMTRTIPVNGKFSARQKQVYQAVLHVLKQATSLLRPGINNELWHKEVCLIMQEQLIKLGLISEYDVQIQHDSYPAFFKYYMHGSGHFIGLDVHDVGSRQLMFQPGMVITCEPGIYIPEENIGIRLENNILIDNQPINLMADIPIEPDEIEMLMQQKK